MSKIVNLNLRLEFADSILENDIESIAKKVADALRHECDSGNGLAPDETYTEKIIVSSENVVLANIDLGDNK